MNRRQAFQAMSAGLLALQARRGAAAPQHYVSPIGSKAEPMAKGIFQPTWESLEQYQTPEWYRDAKFGIWAHWGAAVPARGRRLVRAQHVHRGQRAITSSTSQPYGHPSKFGFKDVIHDWKAENWNPEKLVALYKRAGAQYFFALANHHDNFDNCDSKYQPWNSVQLGPKKDLIGGWAKRRPRPRNAVRRQRSRGPRVDWYEVAQGADKKGDLAGVPYDGKLTKADGKGHWWEGLDPQDLYAQNHTPARADNSASWDWRRQRGASMPDAAYCEKFYNRTVDLINKYHPDLSISTTPLCRSGP